MKGTPFNYFSFGAAVAEVEIDCLTGDHEVRRNSLVWNKLYVHLLQKFLKKI